MPKKGKFDSIESLENWVSWDYFKSVLHWPNDKIAYELDVNERKLIEWVGERGARMTELMGSQPKKVEAIRAELAEKFPIAVAKDREEPSITIKKAVEMLRDGKSIRDIAKATKCPENDFMYWWSRHVGEIDTEFKKQQNTY